MRWATTGCVESPSELPRSSTKRNDSSGRRHGNRSLPPVRREGARIRASEKPSEGPAMTETNGQSSEPALSPENQAVIQLTRKDFVSDQEVRWCPGCGDYSILAQTQKVMPDFGYPRENIVFISGIGCSGRLPYYMNTFGGHAHRAPAGNPRAGWPSSGLGLRRGPPELQHLQRWCVSRFHGPRGARGSDAAARGRPADDLRQGSRQGNPPAGPPPRSGG